MSCKTSEALQVQELWCESYCAFALAQAHRLYQEFSIITTLLAGLLST